MATVNDVVTRAHRIIQVAATDLALTAEQGANGLQALNSMLAGWASQGVNVGHVDYAALSDTFETTTLTAQFREDVTFMLAETLAPEYGRTLSREAAQRASDAWRTLQANFLNILDQTVDSGLQRMPSQRWGWSSRYYNS